MASPSHHPNNQSDKLLQPARNNSGTVDRAATTVPVRR
jgi:hypothetical protein